MEPYFRRTGDAAFAATAHTGGAWKTDEQHIAPALGLLAHVVEADRDARRSDGLVLTRLSYDILGVLPVGDVTTTVTVLRPGRTIELVEATLAHGERDAVRLRAWLMAPRDTAAVAGTALEAIPGPTECPDWDPTTVWPGGFIASAQVRRTQQAPGRATYWVRTDVPLLDEPVSRTASAAGLLDIANGMTVRADPRAVAFPNVDLTAHLYSAPGEGWLGFDTRVSFGADGLGLTETVLHDESGPIGSVSQMLTVRP
ncbi:thioesterase family protein [Tsukamurella sp. 8F]|uniref:thioesterase family protein n=1 Tax=unclassified Tsukamurella TaxID=2633480 RepID=UPI0023BA255C|nr:MULTISPECIES: thioesterase family protein [unclassified Tsukamurella]MDF0532492.1 thioesterase family protein [Tsukamurella sp. 8J]MDF0589163.1 thioesterase family protein [Tsukamurella sp. 8F]